MLRVLFVCSGNICRSPMAAVIAEKLFAEAGIKVMILSAGTLGIRASAAAPHAITALQQVGLSLEHHRSQGTSLGLLRAADYVVAMAPIHEEEILEGDPSLARKIVRLWEYATPPGRLTEIVDPVGQDLEAFVACRADLEECLAAWVRFIAKTRPR